MIPEVGNFALVAALMAAIYQAVFPFAGVLGRDQALAATAASASIAQLGLVLLAFILLTIAHATSDFSVLNVVQNSHTAKPFVYKLTGVWGNHEGSMLLWVLILALFGAALAGVRNEDAKLKAKTLAVQGAVAAAFLAFIIFTSNPFARVFPAPADGMDLNPLLQDPGLIIHPPFLYLGYVGYSVVFSFAVAGLLRGKIDADWARAVRPWALAAWVFLTIGIALGSWWAYYELGWGGFWAWDPVENASFMPWLAGTAFLHSVRVLEKRDGLKVWTVLLAILAFSLSLVGTFLVRSGILTSVHAFAVDPTRGVFILAILGAAIGGSLLVFALRAPLLKSTAAFSPVSREGAILFNNILMSTACVTVFVGTFYPLFIDVLTGQRISVGAPYFNAVFRPIGLILFLVIAPAAALGWKNGDISGALRRLWPAGLAALAVFALALFIAWPKHATAAVGAGLAVWAGAGTIIDFLRRINVRANSIGGALANIGALPRSYVGMSLAHLGVAIVLIGILGAGLWRSEKVVFMQPEERVVIGGYDVRLDAIIEREGPNFIAETATFTVMREERMLRALSSERRYYPVRGMQTTEAGIWTSLKGDLYLTVGERHPERGQVVRAFYNPFAVWMWIGSGVITLGGAVAAVPRRRRQQASAASKATVKAPA